MLIGRTMETFTEQLDALWENTQTSILEAIRKSPLTSEHCNFQVIKVDDERSFNLNGGRWLTEVSIHGILDNKGLTYGYGVLTHEQLAELADWIKIYTKSW